MPDTPGRSVLLYDLSKEGTTCVGVAVEYDDRVDVALPMGYYMPRYYREPIKVGDVEGPRVKTIHPGHPAYFSHVVVDLSRAFAVVDPPHSAGQALNQEENR